MDQIFCKLTLQLISLVSEERFFYDYYGFYGNILKNFISFQIRLINLLSSSLCNYSVIYAGLCTFAYMCILHVWFICMCICCSVFVLQFLNRLLLEDNEFDGVYLAF